MKQRSKQRWDLLAPKGHVLVGDLTLSSIYEAKQYVERYISSFNGWSYVIIPRRKNENG